MSERYQCQVCGVVDQDIRHVSVECMYAVDEVAPHARYVKVDAVDRDSPLGLFRIQCCKDCRADFLKMFGEWAAPKEFKSEPAEGILVRQLGTTVVMTAEEYREYRKQRGR